MQSLLSTCISAGARLTVSQHSNPSTATSINLQMQDHRRMGLPVQAILAVEASGSLTMAGPCARTPERNIETVAAFNLGSSGTRILSGQLCNMCSLVSGFLCSAHLMNSPCKASMLQSRARSGRGASKMPACSSVLPSLGRCCNS